MQLSSRPSWRFLLATVVLVPLAVGVVPLTGAPVTLNVFVQAKLIVLCLMLALALGSWAFINLREGTLFSGRALIPLGAFVLVAGISTATALSPRLAFFGDFEQGVGLLVVLLCALTAFLATQLVRNEALLGELTSAVILTATAVAVIGLLQQLQLFDVVLGPYARQLPEWILQRGYGTIGNPDTYSAYVVLPTLLALHRLRRAVTTNDRILWGASVAAMLITLVMAQTRAPLVGLVVGGFVYVLGESRSPRKPTPASAASKAGTRISSRVVLALVLVAVAAGVVATMTLGTALDFGERFGSVQTLLSLGGRLPLWTSAVEIAANHPLLGVGPDSFRLGWYPVREVAHLANGAGLVITDPHNVPLLIVATMGIAGLLASVYLVVSAVITGFRMISTARAAGRHGSDYDAWLYGTIALSVTLLASMLTSVLTFMLFLGLGVLVAPALSSKELPNKSPRTALHIGSVLAAASMLVFAILTAVAQATATGASTDDAQLAADRAARSASLAPWDTEVRRLRHQTMLQATLEDVFTGEPDGPSRVKTAEDVLAGAASAEPYEYLHPYHSALLLIGSGQELAAEYTVRGIEAGLRGLDLYPNSLELRTGIASGYLQLGDPQQAERVLQDIWAADPAYPQSGLTYAEALLAHGRRDEALVVLSVLQERFPDNPTVADLASRAFTN
ncbi:MAG: tetratricopeptide repeat protein [Coriobacteriia bacterium]|nr:tetratricopeptide repeat protein [Coriobacteriia bacterium]